ncbi:MAG: glycosyltransferase family 39 protein, partial [Pseudomonadota bacterium]
MFEQIRKWGAELRRPKLVVFSFALIVALLFLLVIWPNQSQIIRADDPYGFSVLGRSIAEGRGLAQLAHPDLPTMRRAPLYPAFIALLYILGGPNTMLVRLAQCLLAAGSATLAFAIGERVFSRSVGLLAGVLCAIHPMMLRYAPDLQVEACLTFFMTLMVWCGVRFVDEPTAKRGFALGAVGALGALIKGVLVICPPIFGCWWLIQQWRRGKGLPLVPVIAIAAAMCVV